MIQYSFQNFIYKVGSKYDINRKRQTLTRIFPFQMHISSVSQLKFDIVFNKYFGMIHFDMLALALKVCTLEYKCITIIVCASYSLQK